MKKKLSLLLSFIFVIAALEGVLGNVSLLKYQKAMAKEDTKTVKVFYPDGIPALTIAKMAKENPVIDANTKIDYEVQSTSDALVAKVISSQADIAIVPSNLAALAYNKKLPYKLAAASGYGSLFVVSRTNIPNIKALKGRIIYNIGQGLTPDIVFNYILSKNGINKNKDIQTIYLNGATELAPVFISGKAKVAVMPEPMLSMVLLKCKKAKVYFDLNKEWGKITGSKNGFPQSCIIIKKELIEKDKNFVNNFLKKYQESISWANKNPDKLGDYAEALKLSMNKAIVKSTIVRANIKYVPIKDCKKDFINYYKVLLSFAPKSIGGKLPDESLYLEK